MRQWSTGAVDSPHRLDYWIGAICEAFLEMDCSSRDARSFEGTLTRMPGDTIAFNQVLASTQDVYRTPRGIARSAHNHFYLIGQFDRGWQVRQGGILPSCGPGTSFLWIRPSAMNCTFPIL